MVSDRVYRKGRNKQEAFEELRRCAGSQFDPELVERFIEAATDFGATFVSIGSKQSATQIGQQIERLAQAVDAQDRDGIKALASRLEATAARGGIPEIETVAAEIKEAAGDAGELFTLVEMVSELIDLCGGANVFADLENPGSFRYPGYLRRHNGCG